MLDSGERAGQGRRGVNGPFPPALRKLPRTRAHGWSFVHGAAGVGLAIAAGMALLQTMNVASLALLFLPPVMIAAARGGIGPGLATSALAALGFNFFLVPPRFTLWIFDPNHVLTMVLLFAVALVISELGSRLRTAAEQAEEDAADSRLLATTGRTLAAQPSAEAVETLLCRELNRIFKVRAAVLQVESDGVTCRATSDAAPDLADLDLAAARWVDAHHEIAGRGQAVMASAEWLFAPLWSSGLSFGVVAVARSDAQPAVLPARMRLFTGLALDASQALARLHLAGETAMLAARQERDRLREALLSSVSHDLRTPLTVILGELDSISGAGADRIRSEARRLDRRIDNLLGMSRIEAGATAGKTMPTDLSEAVAAAIDDMAGELHAHRLTLSFPPDLPLVRADPGLLHHMLINLIDNARKHAQATITIEGRHGDGVELVVADDGPGLAEGTEDLVFDRFRQFQGSDRHGGSGLGLAIVRAFAESMGAVVSAGRASEGGAMFVISFPAKLIMPSSLAAE